MFIYSSIHRKLIIQAIETEFVLYGGGGGGPL